MQLGLGESVLSADSGEELCIAERDRCAGVARGGVVLIIHRLFPARHPCGSLRGCSCLPIAGVESIGLVGPAGPLAAALDEAGPC